MILLSYVPFFSFLFLLGIPLGMFLLMRKNRAALYDTTHPKHEDIQFALGGMYMQYEEKYYWFELVLLLNKVRNCCFLEIIS